MKFGLPISLLLHVGVFVSGMIAFSSSHLDADQQKRVVPVELLTVDEFTNIRAAVRTQPWVKPSDAPMTLENPMEFAPEEGEAQSVDSAPELTPPDVTDLPSEQEAEEVLPDKPEPEEPVFNLDDMAALIDRTRETQEVANQQNVTQSAENRYEFAETARSGSGEASAMTMSELEALQSAMYKCWRIPLDAKNPEELGVRVRVQLLPDGSVRNVELRDKALVASSSNPFMKVAAQRAVSAVSKCAPYDFLPEEKYASWQDMILHFKPDV